MQKANYKYYLTNGARLEYSLSSDCSLISVIDRLAADYATATICTKSVPVRVLVRPDIASLLIREVAMHLSFNPPYPSILDGFATLKLQTIIGAMDVVPTVDLEFPIFIGSNQEYEDNSFSTSMEKILV